MASLEATPVLEVGPAVAPAIVRVARLPVHPMLVSFPIACLVGTLLTDLAYWRTAEMMWADFSAWLIAAGVVLGWIAALLGLIDLFGHRYVSSGAAVAGYAIGNIVALILATFNMFVHTRDAWTSVVPWGLALSVATVIVLLITTIMGWTMLYRSHGAIVP
jgi:uncharacterized membrane protein